MKKLFLIFIQIILSAFMISSVCFAAPTIDGNMHTDATTSDEWQGHVTTDYSYPYGNEWYDVEKLGLWIDDNMLYIGLQTDFNLSGGWGTSDSTYENDEYGNKLDTDYRVDPGDFAFDFENDGSYEAGIDFQISENNDVSLTFFKIDSSNNWINPVITSHAAATPYSASPSHYSYSQQNGTGADNFTADIAFVNDDDRRPGDVIEMAINLDTLSTELGDLFSGTNKDLNLHWTMECGNDVLNVQQTYSYNKQTNSGDPVPEPATLLLFGMGLLGAGAMGRQRTKKEKA